MEVKRLKNYVFTNPKNFGSKTVQNNTNFTVKTTEEKEQYSDPLMQWPLRGLAYTNEIGVAISEVAPALGQALWIPTLMYIGADIYDKYKNNDTQYDPNHHRGVKQAVFQGLASVAFPTFAVMAGQKLFSIFGLFSKSKLSLNAKEKISNYAVDFISTGHLSQYASNEAECKDNFKKGLTNVLNFKQNEKKLQDIKGFLCALARNPVKALSYSPKAEVAEIYAEETITNLLKLRQDLLDGQTKTKENLKWHTQVDKNMLKGADKATAVRDTLVKFQKSKISKGKWIKTIGGFLALGLVVKPIDHFVEEIILKKYIEPGLNGLTKNSKQQQM